MQIDKRLAIFQGESELECGEGNAYFQNADVFYFFDRQNFKHTK